MAENENTSNQSWFQQHWEIAKHRATHPREVYEEQKQELSRLFHDPVGVTKEEAHKAESTLKSGWNSAAGWANGQITNAENTEHKVTHPVETAKNSFGDEIEAFFLTIKDVAEDAWHAIGSNKFSEFHFADAWKNDHDKELAQLQTGHSVAPSHLVPTFS